jgi:hypothetical protein
MFAKLRTTVLAPSVLPLPAAATEFRDEAPRHRASRRG